jgi:hypothetical protein
MWGTVSEWWTGIVWIRISCEWWTGIVWIRLVGEWWTGIVWIRLVGEWWTGIVWIRIVCEWWTGIVWIRIVCEWWTGIVWIRIEFVEHYCKPPGALEGTKFLDQSVCSLEKNSSLSDKVYRPTTRHYLHTCRNHTRVLHLEVFDNFHWQLDCVSSIK